MSRMPVFSSPLLLGFDEMERLLERASRSAGDAYPPYNIEQLDDNAAGDVLRIVVAVAGFGADDLSVTVERNQLVISGKQSDQGTREFLHQGIAARQFQRSFVLAEGLEVTSASLEHGLLAILLHRVEPERMVRHIPIETGNA